MRRCLIPVTADVDLQNYIAMKLLEATLSITLLSMFGASQVLAGQRILDIFTTERSISRAVHKFALSPRNIGAISIYNYSVQGP